MTKINQLVSPDRILVHLHGAYRALPVRTKQGVVYKADMQWTGQSNPGLSEFRAVVISNDTTERKLKVMFVSKTLTGIALLDYFTVKAIWKWNGETNASTVVQQRQLDTKLYLEVNQPNVFQPSDIYREVVDLRV